MHKFVFVILIVLPVCYMNDIGTCATVNSGSTITSDERLFASARWDMCCLFLIFLLNILAIHKLIHESVHNFKFQRQCCLLIRMPLQISEQFVLNTVKFKILFPIYLHIIQCIALNWLCHDKKKSEIQHVCVFFWTAVFCACNVLWIFRMRVNLIVLNFAVSEIGIICSTIRIQLFHVKHNYIWSDHLRSAHIA